MIWQALTVNQRSPVYAISGSNPVSDLSGSPVADVCPGGYLPPMVKWTVRVETIRTTADGAGSSCGVVTGKGATPEQAQAELRRAGEELARRLVQEEEAAEADKAAKGEAEERAAYETESDRVQKEEHLVRVPRSAVLAAREREPRRGRKPRLFRFEVVDVRLTPAPEDGGRGGWLAYGTLARLGE
jgi:hypothetical protein